MYLSTQNIDKGGSKSNELEWQFATHTQFLCSLNLFFICINLFNLTLKH